MYEHVREIIDDLKYVIADLVNDVRNGKVKQSEILDELGDRLEQYCGIYIDEEIKND